MTFHYRDVFVTVEQTHSKKNIHLELWVDMQWFWNVSSFLSKQNQQKEFRQFIFNTQLMFYSDSSSVVIRLLRNKHWCHLQIFVATFYAKTVQLKKKSVVKKISGFKWPQIEKCLLNRQQIISVTHGHGAKGDLSALSQMECNKVLK